MLIAIVVFTAPLAQASFPDVADGHPNKVAIEFLQQKGVISGAGDGNFYPGRAVNRAEFLKMALLSALIPESNDGTADFSDVDAKAWFFGFVKAASTRNIVEGYSDGTFQPARTVNKVEALKMLLLAHSIQATKPIANPFADVDKDAWFSNYVDYVKTKNLVGITGTNFGPSEELTRAELAEIIYRLMYIQENSQDVFTQPVSDKDQPTMTSLAREVMETGGIKHSVPLEDILAGGPPMDGIPSIDDPSFTTVAVADEFLNDEGLGVAVSFNGIDRFYPHQITVWHELVNDNIGGQPALISYCPLCGTGIAFEPIINGKAVEFGTSGKLWNSNLVMYDRETDTYWSQVLGEAIVGELTGMQLTRLPYDNMRWKDWKKLNPDGEVLSKDTGYFRNYNTSPYGDYDTNTSVYFPVDNEDSRYHRKELTFGIVIDGVAKAYTYEELDKSTGSFTDELAGVPLSVEYNKDIRTIEIIRTDTGQEIVPDFGFWFSWISVRPESEVYEAE